MTEIEKTYGLLEIPLYTENKGLYRIILNRYKGILSTKDGCKIHFYKPSPLIVNEFDEKSFYPRKIEKLKKSQQQLSDLTELLKDELQKLEELSEDLLKSDKLDKTFITEFTSFAKNTSTSRSLNDELKKYNLLRNDLWHHLPKFNIELLIATWKVEAEKAPVQLFNSEGEPFRVGGETSIHLPIINDDRKQLMVYVNLLPFPLIGRGYVDVWKYINGKWDVAFYNSTWIS